MKRSAGKAPLNRRSVPSVKVSKNCAASATFSLHFSLAELELLIGSRHYAPKTQVFGDSGAPLQRATRIT
jgi:hypothetical protein